MMKKFLVMMTAFVLCFSAEAARAKKVKPLPTNKVPVKFDIKYYYQLNYANRVKYIKSLRDLAQTINKEYDQKKGKRKTAFFELLLVPTVDAAGECFSGGIGYDGPNCGRLPESLATVTGVFSCASGQQRCSVVFGVNDAGNGFCYNQSQEGNATSVCQNQSNEGALTRLAERLNSCQTQVATSTNCQALVNAFNNDTAAMDAYCRTRPTAGACVRTKNTIAALAQKRGVEVAPNTPMRSDDQSCNEADNSIFNSSFTNGAASNPMWMKLLSMSTTACGGNDIKTMEQQMGVFGVCTTQGSLPSNDPALDQAIQVVQNPGHYTDAVRGDADLNRAFTQAFGININEFRQTFCGTTDSRQFLSKADGLFRRDRPAVSQDFSAEELLALYFRDAGLRSIAPAADSRFAGDIRSYGEFKRAEILLESTWEQHRKECQCSRNSTATMCTGVTARAESCSLEPTSRQAFQSHRSNSDMQAAWQRMLSAVNAKQATINATTDPQRKRELVDAALTRVLPADAIARVREYALANRERNVAGTTAMGARESQARDAFKACLDNAFTVADNPNDRTSSTVTNNYGQRSCGRTLIDNLHSRTGNQPVRLRVRAGTGDPLSNRCFLVTERPIQSGHNLRDCTWAVRTTASTTPFLCVDDQNRYEMHQMFCRPGGANPVSPESVR